MIRDFLKEYNNKAPIGNVLRKDYQKHCFRVHNLEDKQYPKNNDDKNKIISLYNKIINTTCTSSKLLGFLSFYDYDFTELDNTWIKDLNLNFLKKYNINEKDDEPYYIRTYTFQIDKNSPILKNMILDIADEEFDGSLLFYCKKNNFSTSLAPYPGGMDIFIQDKEFYDSMLNQITLESISIKKCP